MAKDFSEIYKNYKGQWVALTGDEEKVVASGKKVSSVLDEAKTKGVRKPILFKVPTKVIPYVGSF
jgi:hypothetical protein